MSTGRRLMAIEFFFEEIYIMYCIAIVGIHSFGQP